MYRNLEVVGVGRETKEFVVIKRDASKRVMKKKVVTIGSKNRKRLCHSEGAR